MIIIIIIIMGEGWGCSSFLGCFVFHLVFVLSVAVVFCIELAATD